MIPHARVRHAIAGRTRIAVESKRHDLDYYVRVVQQLNELPEVLEVTANPRSAGLLLIHEEGALQAIVETGPWSDAAWRALELSRRPSPRP